MKVCVGWSVSPVAASCTAIYMPKIYILNMTAATKNQFVNVFRVQARQSRETLTFRRTTLAAAAVAIAVAYFPIRLQHETKRNETRRTKCCQVTPLAAAMSVL